MALPQLYSPATPKSSNSLKKQQCNLLWFLFPNSKAKTWNMYALAYCWVVIALAPSGRFENLFLTHIILRLPYVNAVANGISPSKLSQTCSHTILVGPHTALPSIGNPVRIAIFCRVIDISQVRRWNVWVSGCHRSTKEVTRLQSISICGRRVTRYSLH